MLDHKNKAAAPFGTAAGLSAPEVRALLGQVAGNLVELGAEIAADARQSANAGNRDQSGDQAVLDGSRTLFILDQLQKLAHGLRSLVPSATEYRRNLHSTLQDSWNLGFDR